jgi:putative transposase
VLDIFVQPRRDAKAAKRCFRRRLKGLQYMPRVIVTDKLRSYGVAHANCRQRLNIARVDT